MAGERRRIRTQAPRLIEEQEEIVIRNLRRLRIRIRILHLPTMVAVVTQGMETAEMGIAGKGRIYQDKGRVSQTLPQLSLIRQD